MTFARRRALVRLQRAHAVLEQAEVELTILRGCGDSFSAIDLSRAVTAVELARLDVELARIDAEEVP